MRIIPFWLCLPFCSNWADVDQICPVVVQPFYQLLETLIWYLIVCPTRLQIETYINYVRVLPNLDECLFPGPAEYKVVLKPPDNVLQAMLKSLFCVRFRKVHQTEIQNLVFVAISYQSIVSSPGPAAGRVVVLRELHNCIEYAAKLLFLFSTFPMYLKLFINSQ